MLQDIPLGEYTALVVAGALSFEDGLKLVRLRGMLMQKAGRWNKKAQWQQLVGLMTGRPSKSCAKRQSTGRSGSALF